MLLVLAALLASACGLSPSEPTVWADSLEISVRDVWGGVVALTMTGYPGETADDRKEHAAFMARLDADDTGTLGVTVVLPGTQLYSEAVAAGQISDDIWLGPGRHLIATSEGPRMWSEA